MAVTATHSILNGRLSLSFETRRRKEQSSYVLGARNRRGQFVLDTQHARSSATKLLAEIETTGKAILGILVSHPHPDHIGGLAALHRAYPDAPICASKETHEILQTDAQGYIKLSKQALAMSLFAV